MWSHDRGSATTSSSSSSSSSSLRRIEGTRQQRKAMNDCQHIETVASFVHALALLRCVPSTSSFPRTQPPLTHRFLHRTESSWSALPAHAIIALTTYSNNCVCPSPLTLTRGVKQNDHCNPGPMGKLARQRHPPIQNLSLECT